MTKIECQTECGEAIVDACILNTDLNGMQLFNKTTLCPFYNKFAVWKVIGD